jgi:transcriptional regulator with XRE-family HTH domain
MPKSVHTSGYAALRAELRKTREAAGLSQRALATRLGVAHSVVAKIETGERRIDLVELCWYVTGCGADPLDVATQIICQVPKRPAARPTRGGRAR